MQQFASCSVQHFTSLWLLLPIEISLLGTKILHIILKCLMHKSACCYNLEKYHTYKEYFFCRYTKNAIKNQFLKWQIQDFFLHGATRYIALWGHVPIFFNYWSLCIQHQNWENTTEKWANVHPQALSCWNVVRELCRFLILVVSSSW